MCTSRASIQVASRISFGDIESELVSVFLKEAECADKGRKRKTEGESWFIIGGQFEDISREQGKLNIKFTLSRKKKMCPASILCIT